MLKNTLLAISLIVLEWRVKKYFKKNLNNVSDFSYIPHPILCKNSIKYHISSIDKYDWPLDTENQQYSHCFTDPNITYFCKKIGITGNKYWIMTKEMEEIINQHFSLFFHNKQKEN